MKRGEGSEIYLGKNRKNRDRETKGFIARVVYVWLDRTEKDMKVKNREGDGREVENEGVESRNMRGEQTG